MLYTAEDKAPFSIVIPVMLLMWQPGIIDVADGLLLLYPDFRTPCWVLVNPVLNAAIDEFRQVVIEGCTGRRRSMSGFDMEPSLKVKQALL